MGETKQVQISSLKKGSYVLVDGVACVVKSIQLSKPGKHGAKKARVEAVGVINKAKKIFVSPASESIQVPIIEKRNAQVLSISDDVANIMDMESYETFDLPILEELKGKLTEGAQVVYWIVMDEKVIKQLK